MGIKVISIEWNGQKGTINENEAFEAAEAIEDHVTVFELYGMLQDHKSLKIAQIAKAYAALCRVAGIKAEPKDVASALRQALRSTKKGEDGFWSQVMGVVNPLLNILTDGAPEGESGEDKDPGNAKKAAS